MLLKFTLCDKRIGASCSIENSTEKGICKSFHDCPSENEVNDKPTFCNAGGFDRIICCSQTKKYTETGFKIFKSDCYVNGEVGVHKLVEHCPKIQKEIENGFKPPVICEENFCTDLVCCPIDKETNRLKNVCKDVDDPFEAIRTRLQHFNYSCTIENSDKKGFITNKQFCKTSTDQKVCIYDFCEGWTCCENEHFTENPECNRYFHANIKFIGNSCTDELSETTGTCRLIDHCPEVNGRALRNLTICGYDCCTPFVCCPMLIDSHPVSKSSNFDILNYFCTLYSKHTLYFSVLKI